MTSVIYASTGTLLIIWLSLHVIRIRQRDRVSVGDGGIEELKTAMGAQSNAVEYIPIGLLLLFALQYNGGHMILVHLAGTVLIAGRILHARAMHARDLKGRVLGMQITIYCLIFLAGVNLLYLPWVKLIAWV